MTLANDFYLLVAAAVVVIVVMTGARRWRQVRAARRELNARRPG